MYCMTYSFWRGYEKNALPGNRHFDAVCDCLSAPGTFVAEHGATVSRSAPVPEPASLLIFISAFLGMAGYRFAKNWTRRIP